MLEEVDYSLTTIIDRLGLSTFGLGCFHDRIFGVLELVCRL